MTPKASISLTLNRRVFVLRCLSKIKSTNEKACFLVDHNAGGLKTRRYLQFGRFQFNFISQGAQSAAYVITVLCTQITHYSYLWMPIWGSRKLAVPDYLILTFLVYQTKESPAQQMLNAKCQVIACPSSAAARRRRRAHLPHDQRLALGIPPLGRF